MRFLVLGGEGLLGKTLVSTMKEKGEGVASSDRRSCDVRDIKSVEHLVSKEMPDVIVNCSGYTDVDMAQKDHKEAFLVNAIGVNNLAIIASYMNIKLVSIGSDYIFDGKSTKSYREEDMPNPINSYGKSKLWGERLMLRSCPGSLSIRTASLFGHGKSFISRALERLRKGEKWYASRKRVSSITYVTYLARAIYDLIDKDGVIHFTNKGSASRWEIYNHVVNYLRDRGAKVGEVCPLELDLTPRPIYSVLSISKIEAYISLGNSPLEKSYE